MLAICRSPFSPYPYSKRYFSHLSRRHGIDLSLCLVTDRKCVKSDEEFFSKISRAIEGGVTCIQLRDQNEDLQASLRSAYRLKDRIPLIINNRVDVALAVGTGVHLGKKDFPLEDARRLLGQQAIIGWTVETLDDVHIAEKLDVDYLGVQLFPSKNTKLNHTRIWGIEGLKQIRSLSRHRLVAIGGITLDNLETVCSQLQLGRQGDGIAMVGELWRGNNPSIEAQKIQAIFNRIKR